MDGRFAPSPSGEFHLGNLRTALLAWLFARSANSRFLLRFEDLDGAVVKDQYYDAQMRDLQALGLDWDGTPLRQTGHADRYRDALADLERGGQTYRCWCSRREIREAAAAPHGDLPEGHYPGTCLRLSQDERRQREASDRPPALRFRAEQQERSFVDQLCGETSAMVDDFVLRRGDGVPSYNLVVVLDDDLQGVEQVVRADDLLTSTPRQLLLMDHLGMTHPAFAHVPLVLGPEGKRLAKRDGAVTLADRLALGHSPAQVLSQLAGSLHPGLTMDESPESAADLLGGFNPSALPRAPWTLTPQELGSSPAGA